MGAVGVGEVESVSQQSEGSSSSPGSPLQPCGPEPVGEPGKSSSSSSLDTFKVIDESGLMMTTVAQSWCMMGNIGSYYGYETEARVCQRVHEQGTDPCSSPSSPSSCSVFWINKGYNLPSNPAGSSFCPLLTFLLPPPTFTSAPLTNTSHSVKCCRRPLQAACFIIYHFFRKDQKTFTVLSQPCVFCPVIGQ